MAIIAVTSNANSGTGSLREAIANAQSGDTIVFDPSLANQTITLTSKIVIDQDLTIDGANAPGLTISGNQETPIFQVTGDGRELTVQNLTFTDAFHEYAGAVIWVQGANTTITVENSEFYNNIGGQGPAIWAKNGANVTVLNSKFDGNQATQNVDSAGGAISVFDKSQLTVIGSEFTNNEGYAGGAISTIFTPLTVEDSIFLNNESRSWGGAINNDGASVPSQERYYDGDLPRDSEGGETIIRNSYFEGNSAVGVGGAVAMWGYDQDYVTVENSTIINNQVTQSANGTAKGGGLSLMGFITISNTTIANNQSENLGGGLAYHGGVPATITNSTFSGNVAEGPNGEGLGGAIYSAQWSTSTNIVNTTFANNYAASEAGAIYQHNKPLSVINSIFDNNTTGDPANPNQQTNVELAGENNLQSPNTGNNVTENITIADPLLGSLQEINGVLVHPLLSGSPAIDAGTSHGAPSIDQAGNARPQDGDFNGTALFDLGAYEVPDTIEMAVEDALNLINGTNLSETLVGTTQNDRIKGLGAQDTLTGGLGNDQLYGNMNHDRLWGEEGDDLLYGGKGYDQLYGGAGQDRIWGNPGNDLLYGGLGNDILTGGSDRDIFVLASGQGTDLIRDFQVGEDKLGLVGMSWENLSMGQTGNYAWIGDNEGQLLAVLEGVDVSLLTAQAATTFVTI